MTIIVLSCKLALCPDHTSHEENGLVNKVEFLGPQTYAPAQACATSPATASSGLAITTSLAW